VTGDEPLLERVATAADAGARIDRVLARWLHEPRARAQARLAAGDVNVDGRPAAKSATLHAGQRVVVGVPAAPPAPDPPPSVPVRYEDEHLAVVAKPAGLVVHAGAGTRGAATLVDALRAAGMTLAAGTTPGDAERPGIVHRLDRGTSGLLVVAKSPATRAALVALLKRRAIQREYWALVEGVPEPRRATIDAPIGRSAARRTLFAVDAAGRPAVTHYDVLADHGRAAEVAVRLATGRTHQIRVHMAAVGHPVVGDRRYGASPLGAELGLGRPALHARRVRFMHPVTGATVDVEEPLPADLAAACRRLRGR
jgi:23S rRNA pseudouridine1911/1915/1917 synthase